jgi:hypothetical protein
MDIMKMLSELRSERAHLEEAILVLERLARGHGKRRGRPPKWMSESRVQDQLSHTEPRKKRVISPEARAKMAAAQRKRWAAIRRGQTQES